MKYYLLYFYFICCFLSCISLSPVLRDSADLKSDSVRKMWIRETFQRNYRQASVFQSISPELTEQGWIIQGNMVNGVWAYEQEKGLKKWFFPVKGGVAGGVSVEKNKVFFAGADGFIYSLHLTTGDMIWKYHTGSTVSSTPALMENRLYFSTPFQLYTLNAKTGELIWKHTNSVSSGERNAEFIINGVAKPLVTKKTVYYRSSDGYVTALDKNGKSKWNRRLSNFFDRFTSAVSVPVIKGNKLYVAGFQSGLYCLDKKSGKIIWKNSQGSHSTVLLSGDRLFYSTSNGQILALDQTSGKQLWAYQLEESIATSLVVYKDVLIYGEYTGGLGFLSKTKGKKIHSFTFGSGLSSKPLISEKYSALYFMSNHGGLYKLKLLF